MSFKESDFQIVQKDSKTLYLGNLNTVEFDIKLPTVGSCGSRITWETGNDKIISAQGKVTRPAYGIGNREVELTATFCYGTAAESKTYLATVLEEENKIKVSKIYPMQIEAGVGSQINLPEFTVVVTEDGHTISHAVTWEDGCTKVFEREGTYTVSGVLKDTKLTVTANVKVLDGAVDNLKNNSLQLSTFTEGEVRLTKGSPFQAAQDRTYKFLLSVDDNQMLYNFRKAAGLDTLGASKMPGWDSPDCLLRGHTTGHYLSSLALCYRALKEENIRLKAIYMVEALSDCQEAFGHKEGFQYGFLSAYSQEQFDLLEKYTRYPKIWAPYYTLHKIMAGLLDCYQCIGIGKALTVVSRLGDWVYNRLSRLTREQRNKMWSMYIAGEFGGMNESLAQLYRITGKRQYLEASKYFDNDKLFYPMSIQVDTLNDMHANQHIPQVIGALQIFAATGEKYYYDVASYFWEAVTKSHCYAIGGTGEGEMFHAPGKIAKQLSKNTAESCASYNMLKLSKELYCFKPDKAYMDYYENTMINHILSSCDCKPNGGTIYFLPLAPGFTKEFDEDGNSCCHGTGLENHFRYVESIYYHTDNSLTINQFISSELDWQEKNIKLSMTVEEEHPEKVLIEMKGSGNFTLKIRKPVWCGSVYHISINNTEAGEIIEENGYLIFDRSFHESDRIHITFGCCLRMEQSPDDSDIVTVFYGPYILTAISEEKEFIGLGLNGRKLDEVLIQQDYKLNFRHIDTGVLFKPLYQVYAEAYQVYIKK